MDTDIRELIGEDDLFFDPFEDEVPEEEPEASPSLDEDVEVPLVGAPMEERPKVVDTRSPRERMDELFEKMRNHKRLFLKLIDYCREPKTCEEMNVRTEELTRFMYSVYSPVIIRELLEDAGAIEYRRPEVDDGGAGAQDADAADEPVESEGSGAREGDAALTAVAVEDGSSGDGAHATASGSKTPFVAAALSSDAAGLNDLLVAVDEAEDGSSGDDASLDDADAPAALSRETFSVGDEEVDVEFLEIEEVEPGTWVATAEGLAYVDEQDDMKASRELLEKEPRYLDIYHQILEFCSDPRGRSAKEVDNLINGSPLLEEPRRYSGYFVGRLEKQGSLEWRSGWYTTDVGMALLAEARERAAADGVQVAGE